MLAAELLPWLGPTDLVLFGQAWRACQAAVVACGVQQAGETSDDEVSEGGPLLLRVEDVVESVELLAWAKARGGRGTRQTCELAACSDNLEVLRWAWEHRCPWDATTCSRAAESGHQQVLNWERQHGCPWNAGNVLRRR